MRTVKVTEQEEKALSDLALSRLEKRAQVSGTGAAVGGGIGALAGALLGYLAHSTTPEDNDEDKRKRLWKHLLGGASLGALSGAGLGAFSVPQAAAKAVSSLVSGGKPITNRDIGKAIGKELDENPLVRMGVGGAVGNLAHGRVGRILDFMHENAPDILYRRDIRSATPLSVWDRSSVSRTAVNPLAEDGAGFLKRLVRNKTTSIDEARLNVLKNIRDEFQNNLILPSRGPVTDAANLSALRNRVLRLQSLGLLDDDPLTIRNALSASMPRPGGPSADGLLDILGRFKRSGRNASDILSRIDRIKERRTLMSRIFSRGGDLRLAGLAASTGLGMGIGYLTGGPAPKPISVN